MSLKLLHIVSVIFLFQGVIFSQGLGSIKGIVYDEEQNEALIGVNIFMSLNDSLIGICSDINGKYFIDSIPAGTYTLNLSFIGKSKVQLNNIKVNPDKISFIDTIRLIDDTILIGCIFPVCFPYKFIDPEDPTTTVITNYIINKISCTRGISYATTDFREGVITVSGDRKIYFRGSRDGSFITYFDGMKIEGSAPAVPMACLKSYSVYTGGLPAKYGDTSGGVVVIETKSFFDLYNQRVAEMGIDYK